MIQKVFKYGTGQEIPEGAIYLCTKTEEIVRIEGNIIPSVSGGGQNNTLLNVVKSNQLVWHYFLVKVEE